MQRNYFILLLLFLATSASAQTKIGFKAGMNLVHGREKNQSEGHESHIMPGLVLGVMMEWPTALENFSIRPELLYTMKGSRSEGYDHFERSDVEYHSITNYLQLPINLVYKIKLLRVFAGPYAAVFINGNYEDKYLFSPYFNGSYTATGKIKATNDIDRANSDVGWIRHFDWGINFGFGIALSPEFDINMHYELGLYNIVPKARGEDLDVKDQNRLLNISLIYFINRESTAIK